MVTTIGSFNPEAMGSDQCPQRTNTCKPCAFCEMYSRSTTSARRLIRNSPLPFSEPTTPSPDGKPTAEPATRHLLAIDPGPERSAWCWFEDGQPLQWMHEPNALVLEMCQCELFGAGMVIEEVASYGMPVGREVFQTVRWAGRFEQAAGQANYLPRLRVKLHHCHSPRANDGTIRQALLDRYGGREMGVGTKKRPGPLYGMSGDCWQALALGIAWLEGAR